MSLIIVDQKTKKERSPNVLDIKTDLRRAIMATFSKDKFVDANFKIFLKNAQKNLELIKQKVGNKKYLEVKGRILKSLDSQNSIEKRREDLLTASSLI